MQGTIASLDLPVSRILHLEEIPVPLSACHYVIAQHRRPIHAFGRQVLPLLRKHPLLSPSLWRWPNKSAVRSEYGLATKKANRHRPDPMPTLIRPFAGSRLSGRKLRDPFGRVGVTLRLFRWVAGGRGSCFRSQGKRLITIMSYHIRSGRFPQTFITHYTAKFFYADT